MTQKKTSVKVPSDLLPAVRQFHDARERINAELLALNTEYQEMHARMQSEQQRLDAEFRAAVATVSEPLIAANIVTKTTVFIVNTEFLEEHGAAYIITNATASFAEERTVH